ncbi:MAG: membrane protein insertase YidC [Lachnospiraceae bacterium]|nr:membrane protein insertase YidC [Lachnospiraceae bacterium]
MHGIYEFLAAIGIENIGITIILFTLIVNLLMMPLTIRQQRFSKMQTKMNPELTAIRKKYEGKRDNASMMAQQEEMKQVYAKYGVSQMGSCLPLLIQLPILWALYRVIYAIPAYVARVKHVFIPLAVGLLGVGGSAEFMQSLSGAAQYVPQFQNEAFQEAQTNEYAKNTYIDVLNRASSADWDLLQEEYPEVIYPSENGPETVHTADTRERVESMNSFLGLNIGDSPSFTISNSWAKNDYLMIFLAIMVPFLAAATQWLNTKLMPTAAASNDPNDPAAQMARQMRTMNIFMPLMSAFICFSLPVGVGLYWIAGAVIRIVQQVFINRHIDKMDLDAMIEKNQEKYKQKLEKRGDRTQNMAQYASMNTRSLASYVNFSGSSMTQEEKDAALEKARSYYDSGKARKNSLLAAANSVRAYEEKNNKR